MHVDLPLPSKKFKCHCGDKASLVGLKQKRKGRRGMLRTYEDPPLEVQPVCKSHRADWMRRREGAPADIAYTVQNPSYYLSKKFPCGDHDSHKAAFEKVIEDRRDSQFWKDVPLQDRMAAIYAGFARAGLTDDLMKRGQPWRASDATLRDAARDLDRTVRDKGRRQSGLSMKDLEQIAVGYGNRVSEHAIERGIGLPPFWDADPTLRDRSNPERQMMIEAALQAKRERRAMNRRRRERF